MNLLPFEIILLYVAINNPIGNYYLLIGFAYNLSKQSTFITNETKRANYNSLSLL